MARRSAPSGQRRRPEDDQHDRAEELGGGFTNDGTRHGPRIMGQALAPPEAPAAACKMRPGMLRDLVAALRTWADQAGLFGLLVLSLVDSAGLPLPNATDALVIYLTLQQPARWWWYVPPPPAGLSSARCRSTGSGGAAGGRCSSADSGSDRPGHGGHSGRGAARSAPSSCRRRCRRRCPSRSCGAGRRHRVAGVAVRPRRSAWAVTVRHGIEVAAGGGARATRPPGSSTSGAAIITLDVGRRGAGRRRNDGLAAAPAAARR